MKIGDKLKGKITGIQPYGAFVELENGTIGLIHISEIRPGYIENIHDSVKIGQQVLVQVVDYESHLFLFQVWAACKATYYSVVKLVEL